MYSIWVYFLIIFIILITSLSIWIRNKYKKLTKKDKKMLEKSLKKMGFFIIILFCITHVSESIKISSNEKVYPIVLPSDSLIQASSIITGQELTEEDIWRANILLFINNTNVMNATNNTINNSMIF